MKKGKDRILVQWTTSVKPGVKEYDHHSARGRSYSQSCKMDFWWTAAKPEQILSKIVNDAVLGFNLSSKETEFLREFYHSIKTDKPYDSHWEDVVCMPDISLNMEYILIVISC